MLTRPLLYFLHFLFTLNKEKEGKDEFPHFLFAINKEKEGRSEEGDPVFPSLSLYN